MIGSQVLGELTIQSKLSDYTINPDISASPSGQFTGAAEDQENYLQSE